MEFPCTVCPACTVYVNSDPVLLYGGGPPWEIVSTGVSKYLIEADLKNASLVQWKLVHFSYAKSAFFVSI
jgi:hypothetical protein